jgi:type IV secretory pathway TrbD component
VTENSFQTAVNCGSVALVACVVLNIWVVMRNVEVYRDATRADVKFQQLAVREQVLRSVLQDFAARANSDPQIAEIFRRAQTVGSTNAVPTNLNPQ